MDITVFLVDDHALIRDGLRSLLEMEQDIKVIGDATSGTDALRQVIRLCPDIVITDLSTHRSDSIEATQQLCEACPSARVIVLSMYSTTEHVYRALRAGSRGYLLKELAGTELVSAVRAVHAGDCYLSHKLAGSRLEDYVLRHQVADTAPDPVSVPGPTALRSLA